MISCISREDYTSEITNKETDAVQVNSELENSQMEILQIPEQRNMGTLQLLDKLALTTDEEEILIHLVSERPPLYDYRLPLKLRSRAIVNKLWPEVKNELKGM